MLNVSASMTEDALLVRYVFDNDIGETVYLRNLLSDWYGLTGDPSLDALRNPRAGVTSALACVEHEDADTALLLVGGTPPPDQEIFAPREPLCSCVAPGARFGALLRLPLPLLEWNAYEPPRSEPTRVVAIQSLHVRIEYLPARSVTHVRAHTVFADAFVVGGRRFEYLDASVALPEPCRLLQRTDLGARAR